MIKWPVDSHQGSMWFSELKNCPAFSLAISTHYSYCASALERCWTAPDDGEEPDSERTVQE